MTDYFENSCGTYTREARPVRGAARRAAETVHNLLYTARQRRAPPPLQLWEIPAGEESALLGRCE